MVDHSRRAYLAAVAGVGIAGCLDAAGQFEQAEEEHGAERDDEAASNGETDPEAASRRDPDDELGATDGTDGGAPPIADVALPLPDEPTRLSERVVSGGVGQDGIPSIDDPSFVDAEAGDEILAEGDPVFGVTAGGEACAYPQHILVWHEIVNDVVGGEPVAVTYCPLTGTAQGFLRGDTEFGVSGQLLNSNLVMYDREAEGYWPQMLATAITGERAGESLREFPVTWTSWESWRETYPGTRVLSEETGYARDYDRDPYGSYNPREGFYADDSLLFGPYSEVDDTFHRKEVVLGARSDDGALAVHKESLADAGVLEATVGGVPHVAVYDPALQTGYVYRNPEERSVTHDGSEVLLDGDTHRPDKLPLERVVRYDAMWFAWGGYYPETEVLQ